MSRTRKPTRSAKESTHLVSAPSEVSDVSPSPQPLINTTVVSETSQKRRSRPSSFQRLFSRPTAEKIPEDLPSGTPRKMVGWPFSRSPRRHRPTGAGDATEVQDPGSRSDSPYSIMSPAVASTSSFGSVIPTHEQLFRLASSDADEPTQNELSSPVTIASSGALERPKDPESTPLGPEFGHPSPSPSAVRANKSRRNILESLPDLLNEARFSEGTDEVSYAMPLSEPERESESGDEDPTPSASTLSPRVPVPHDPSNKPRRRGQRLSLVVPPRDVDVLSLRPAVGVAPHPPSETESLVSPCSPVSPIFPEAHGVSPPHVPTSEPLNPRNSGAFPDISNMASTSPSGRLSPGQCKRAMPRSMTPPPSRRPPPRGPLPAVPSSSVPPVPPLPPLLNKITMGVTSHSATFSSRSGAPPIPAAALPPSPPGGLRLPSRLSWINGVRAVLPSPPASPTRPLKSLANKPSMSITSSKVEKKRSISIGVIEAADSVHVRRTKSILMLGSKSKSNAILGPKRVHIHTEVNMDAEASRKPRRQSSSATVGGHTVYNSDPGPGPMPMPTASPELLVPRERRHSAPLLSALDSKMSPPSADWTLSLPFCTDVPGNKILLSPLLAPCVKPDEAVEGQNGEDWTLCMPLKVRVGTPTVGTSTTEDCDSSACTLASTSDATEARPATMQLPTPSPSPPSSSFVKELGPEEECVPETESEMRPASVSERGDTPRPSSPVVSLGPHVGGLDLAGGRGKRASGWHVYGWFDEVSVTEDDRRCSNLVSTVSSSRPTSVSTPTTTPVTAPSRSSLSVSIPNPVRFSNDTKLTKTLITAFRRAHESGGRQTSQDSMSTVSTSETMFYSARSSLLVN